MYARYSSRESKRKYHRRSVPQLRSASRRQRAGRSRPAMRTKRSAAPRPTARAINRCSRTPKAKQFDVLLVDDFSRLSRDMDETEKATTAARVLGHPADWRERRHRHDHEGHELIRGFKGLMNQKRSRKLAKDIKRGMDRPSGESLLARRAGVWLQAWCRSSIPRARMRTATRSGSARPSPLIPSRRPSSARFFRRTPTASRPLKIVHALNVRQVPAPGAAYKRTILRTPDVVRGGVARGSDPRDRPPQ